LNEREKKGGPSSTQQEKPKSTTGSLGDGVVSRLAMAEKRRSLSARAIRLIPAEKNQKREETSSSSLEEEATPVSFHRRPK